MSKLLGAHKLAHEIATALFRVVALVRHDRLREELESAAIILVREPNLKAIDCLLRLVWLAEAVGEVKEVNARVLIRELGNLRKMIIQDRRNLAIHPEIPEPIAGIEEVDLGDLFIRDLTQEHKQDEDKPLRRREAIRQLIRQFPEGCRMIDIVNRFPEFSERTIRSDIQRLINEGSVEKLGSRSGPFSYLKAVASAPTVFTPNSDLTSQPDNEESTGFTM